jgi:hypothetical protein
MRKKLWTLLLCCALAFGSLTACGGNEGGDGGNTNGEVAPSNGDDDGDD